MILLKGMHFQPHFLLWEKIKALEFMRKHNISGIIVTENDEIIVTRDLLEVFSLFKEYKVLTF